MTTTRPSVLPSVQAHTRTKVASVFSHITAQGSADYIGEPVSQLQHTLQAGYLARQSHADNDTILGALLHDIGRFIPEADEMPAMTSADGTYVGRESHEIVGEKYLRGMGFGEKVCQLVGAHVMAKRYLCSVDEGYWEGLSESSKTTLRYQVSNPDCLSGVASDVEGKMNHVADLNADQQVGRYLHSRTSQSRPSRSLPREQTRSPEMG